VELNSEILELKAVNFDNAVEVDLALSLIKDNLATEINNVKHNDSEKYVDFLSGDKLVSIIVYLEGQAIAHVAFSFDKLTKNVTIFAPAIEKSKLHFKSYINAAFWRTLSRLSKKQGWNNINFSSCYRQSSMSTKEFRALFTKVIPSRGTNDKIITLKDSIEVFRSPQNNIDVAFDDLVEVA